jgi:hypothetical protein
MPTRVNIEAPKAIDIPAQVSGLYKLVGCSSENTTPSIEGASITTINM